MRSFPTDQEMQGYCNQILLLYPTAESTVVLMKLSDLAHRKAKGSYTPLQCDYIAAEAMQTDPTVAEQHSRRWKPEPSTNLFKGLV